MPSLKNLIKKGIPVIVGWFSVDEEHYSVVKEIGYREIKIADPETAKIRTFPLKDFVKMWFGKSPGDKVNYGEIVVVRPKTKLGQK